ncbi:glycosaminoglycan attachment protein [Pseudomonas fluorescens]|uniref:Glycosaminoglycan attachment protein n=1 Tax=Pseudomonas fluorescens TaxID=294 RepID=A0A423NE22_PSEFL|nr:glycosaminoglycan attachment protein [Pseudomonas fluorescens]RON96486.1 glycosaminoglycan attachment protein [Pseudomonas fluorescens]
MNDQVKVSTIDKKRFTALIGASRNPLGAMVSNEIGWFANQDESVLGVLLHDIDDEYAWVTLGRDEAGRYRGFDVGSCIQSKSEAEKNLINKITEITLSEQKEFPQNDKGKALELFEIIVSEEKIHPFFRKLSEAPGFSSAKGIISEMMPHFTDIDGNFVEQFQSAGFDARIWELYLNAYFVEEGFDFNRSYHAPDFNLAKYGRKVCVEATIVGRPKPMTEEEANRSPEPMTREQILEKTMNEMPIKFGSPLYTKLKKEYWKQKHVAGNPLVLAIADFHDQQSMLWSSTSLPNYLYGVHHSSHYDENGKLIIDPIAIETHKHGTKEIPSGYFFQKDAENISAVMFSNSGTISKFNRMGKQAGFGVKNVILHRAGYCHHHDDNASLPKTFSYLVNGECNETWSEGLSMFHNPNALHPVNPGLFPSIAHHFFEDGQIVSNLPDFYPYASTTSILNVVDDDEWEKIKNAKEL